MFKNRKQEENIETNKKNDENSKKMYCYLILE